MIENRELGELLEKATLSWADLNEDDKRTSNYIFIQLFQTLGKHVLPTQDFCTR